MRLPRLLASLTLTCLLASSAPAAAANTTASEAGAQVAGYYVQSAVDLLKRFGIVSGDPDGRMRLGETITRAELAKIVVVAMGQGAAAQKAQAEPTAFSDVKGHWARGFIATARKLGVTSGYEDGTFRPGNPVTHAEAVTMLLRASDLRPAGPWPQSYLDAARRGGILTEALDRSLSPRGQASRATVFLLAERTFTRIPDKSGQTLVQRVFPSANAPRISVTAQGAESGVTKLADVHFTITAPGAVMVQVNGRPAWPAGGQFTLKATLNPGPNDFLVIAVDEIGNRSEHRLLIERR